MCFRASYHFQFRRTLRRKDCVTSQRNGAFCVHVVLSVSLIKIYIFLELFLNAFRNAHFIPSPSFIPSPCFTPSLQSVVRVSFKSEKERTRLFINSSSSCFNNILLERSPLLRLVSVIISTIVTSLLPNELNSKMFIYNPLESVLLLPLEFAHSYR